MTQPSEPGPTLGHRLVVHAEGEVIPGPDPDEGNDSGEDDSGEDREPPGEPDPPHPF
jgi:hypothetical protein